MNGGGRARAGAAVKNWDMTAGSGGLVKVAGDSRTATRMAREAR